MYLSRPAAPALFVALALAALLQPRQATADENLAAFHNLDPEQIAAEAASAVDPFGAVPSDKISLVNLAPVLLPYFNNAPVFGIPGTVTGSVGERTQLTGDWGGARTELARKGVFIDAYTTSLYQNVTSGGLATGESFAQNLQFSLNVDTARAGLWSGGLFHVTVQSRYGDDPENTFTGGGAVPQYTGLVLPGPTLYNDTYPSEYFLVQALNPKLAAVVGKISDIFIPDQTLFADSYKYYFNNFAFNKNPMTVNFYNPTAWAALGVWSPTRNLAFAGGVLDPGSEADNFADDMFADGVNLYLMSIFSYDIAGLPGQFSPAFNWSNQTQVDRSQPFAGLSREQIPQAIGALVGSPETEGLDFNTKDSSWFAIANVSQYLYLKDDPARQREKMRTGQILNGLGLFGRIGYAPEDTNDITFDASAGLFAHGLFDARPYDSFGAGVYYNRFSGDLKDSIAAISAGTLDLKDETGVEVFYDFALTPAIRIVPSYQHIWNPFTAQVADGDDSTDIVLAKLNVAW